MSNLFEAVFERAHAPLSDLAAVLCAINAPDQMITYYCSCDEELDPQAHAARVEQHRRLRLERPSWPGSDEQSAALNAMLVLLLANQIGSLQALCDALQIARATLDH